MPAADRDRWRRLRRQLLASTLPDQLVANMLGGFPVFAGALALVFGALVFGSEYGWGTVKTLLTQRPGRGAVLARSAPRHGVAIAWPCSCCSASAPSPQGIAVSEGASSRLPAWDSRASARAS